MNRIKLAFSTNREMFSIEILNRIITYRDRRQPKGIQFMPKDAAVRRLVILSRNKIPMWMLDWIEEANSGKNLEEYQSAQTDEELVPIIKKDAASKGCIFIKRIDEEVDEQGMAIIQTAAEMERKEVIRLAEHAEALQKAQNSSLEASTIKEKEETK